MDIKGVIDTVNDLIENCKDGEYGFRRCGERAQAPRLRQTFGRRADECQKAASELQTIISQLGGEAEKGGSALGAVHRGWVSVRDALAGSNGDLSVLEECERGEDVALERYNRALEEALPPHVRNIVERQYEGVKRNHEEIRRLRDEARTAQV